jgi:Zn-dependent protease with chaperone function
VRLNTANRSFFTLVATALVPYGLLGLAGCGLLSVLAYRLILEGWSGLHRDGQDLRPAALFLAVVATGTVIAVLSVRRQLVATRRLAADVAARAMPLPETVEHAARRAGLPSRVDVVDDAQPYSFTYGLMAPRVAISRGLVEAVNTDELRAVLHHEHYHVGNADTLKLVMARAAPSAFFFLPALSHLRDRYLAGRELAADRAAVRACGQAPLTTALLKVLDGPAWVDLDVAAALGGGVVEYRVEQLEDGREPPLPRVPKRTRWLTAIGLAVLAAGFVLAVVAAGTDVFSMNNSMPSAADGTALAVAGSVTCSAAVVVAALWAFSGTRHRRTS